MNELLNIIVNVLQNTDNGDSVKFTKKSDVDYLFEGQGTDGAGKDYNYSIEVKYSLKAPEGLSEKAKALKELGDKLGKK